MIEIFGAHGMRMKLQAGEVCHPCQRSRAAGNNLFSGATRRKFQRNDFDPVGARFGRALLVEELAGDAVGIAN
jgi:hypothetical protein